jgi:DeoR/GlpR family transcriptional regulator of sugar metabolism
MNDKNEIINLYKNAKEVVNLSHEERLQLNISEKKSIAEKALIFVHNNKKYFLDSSTSVQLLANLIEKSVDVYTNSLDNIEILSKKENVVIHTTGEYLNKNNRFFYNKGDISYFSDDTEFDVAFLGASAVHEDGVYYVDEEDVVIKKEVVSKSKRVILLAEHQKYQRKAIYKGLDLKDIHIIILDDISSSHFADIMNSENIKIKPETLLIM